MIKNKQRSKDLYFYHFILIMALLLLLSILILPVNKSGEQRYRFNDLNQLYDQSMKFEYDSSDIDNLKSVRDYQQEIYNEWKFQKTLEISPSTPDVDYQIRTELTPISFNYSNANSNGNDIRFSTIGMTSLNYWIETWNTSGSSFIWVKVGTLGTSSILFYYGNSIAISESNGSSTFLLFDDFSEHSLNSDIWENETDSYSTIVLENGIINMTHHTGHNYHCSASLGFSDYVVDHGMTFGSNQSNGVLFSGKSAYTVSDSTSTSTVNIIPQEQWFTNEIRWINSSVVEFDNGSHIISHTTNIPTMTLPIFMGASGIYYGPGTHHAAIIRSINNIGGLGKAIKSLSWVRSPIHEDDSATGYSNLQFDWVFVRKCSSHELSTNFISIDEDNSDSPPLNWTLPSDWELYLAVPVIMTFSFLSVIFIRSRSKKTILGNNQSIRYDSSYTNFPPKLEASNLIKKKINRNHETKLRTREKGFNSILFLMLPLLLFFKGLYRIKNRNISQYEVFENPIRFRIVQILERNKFEYFRELKRQSKCSLGLLTWHLGMLEDLKMIHSLKYGQFRFYYIDTRPTVEKIEIYLALRSLNAQKIIQRFLIDQTGVLNPLNLVKELRMKIKIVNYHISKFEELNLIYFTIGGYRFNMGSYSKIRDANLHISYNK